MRMRLRGYGINNLPHEHDAQLQWRLLWRHAGETATGESEAE